MDVPAARGAAHGRPGASGPAAATTRPAGCLTGTPAAYRASRVSTKPRTDLLTTVELYKLDIACRAIRKAFGHPPYLVGSAGPANLVATSPGTYRDVDVRLMLDDGEFAAVCPTRARWELLCLAVSAYLREWTGLPIDFQVQRTQEANERYGSQMRNPLGMSRVFAGGGDGTPGWEDAQEARVIVCGQLIVIQIRSEWKDIGAVTAAARWRAGCGEQPFDLFESRDGDGKLLDPQAPVGPWLRDTTLYVNRRPGTGG